MTLSRSSSVAKSVSISHTASRALQGPSTHVSHYRISVKLDTSTHTLTCDETVKYVNTAGVSLNEVFFHLWTNAQQELLTLNEVADEAGRPLSHQTVKSVHLRVRLGESVLPGANITVRIRFNVTIPEIQWRLGWSETHFNVANWYPIVAVYDENGWNLPPYSFSGESFYSEVANYDVDVTLPADQIVAASGELVEKLALPNGNAKWVWRARLIRDFSFFCSQDFVVATVIEGDIKVASYYLKGHGARGVDALHVAKNAITTFSSMFKPYPYKTFSVVESDLGGAKDGLFVAGMEYASLILIDDYFYFSSDKRSFETVIAHEVAHQWFAFMVGNNPYKEPWLDESFATYSEIVYYEFTYGPAASRQHLIKMRKIYNDWLLPRGNDQAVGQPMDFWESRPSDYYAVVYAKGALVVGMLRLQVGNATFFRGLQLYFNKFLHRNANATDLISVFEEASWSNMKWFFDEWIYQGGLPTYSVIVVFKDNKNLIVNVGQDGTPKRMLVPFEIKYKEESVTKTAWINETKQTISFEVEATPIDIVPDPQGIILGSKRVKPLWDPLIRVIIAVVSSTTMVFTISKKRKILRPPPTALDHFLKRRLTQENKSSE